MPHADPDGARVARCASRSPASSTPRSASPITELDMVDAVVGRRRRRVEVGIRLTIVGCPASDRIERDVATGCRDPSPAPATSSRALGDDARAAGRAHRAAARRHGRPRQSVRPGQRSPASSRSRAARAASASRRSPRTSPSRSRRAGSRSVSSTPTCTASRSRACSGSSTTRAAARPTRVDDMILPPVAYGVKVISIGMFVEPTEPGGRASSVAVAWRGPMLHRTLNQFLTDVYFGDLDVLLVDLPPGTGDVAISLGQLLPNAEVVVVTTPSPPPPTSPSARASSPGRPASASSASSRTWRGFAEPGGGIVELFGSGGGAEVAERLSAGQEEPVPLLASVPLSIALRRGGDAGAPVVARRTRRPGGARDRGGRERARVASTFTAGAATRRVGAVTPMPARDPSRSRARARDRAPAPAGRRPRRLRGARARSPGLPDGLVTSIQQGRIGHRGAPAGGACREHDLGAGGRRTTGLHGADARRRTGLRCALRTQCG